MRRPRWTRRGFLAYSGFALASSGRWACSPGIRKAEEELTEPLYYSSARALVGALHKGWISSEEVVAVFLRRIEEVNPRLNAVVALVAERALNEAKQADASRAQGGSLGPLHGLPITLKDSIDTAGVTTTGGTPGRRHYVPQTHATVADRLFRAGALLLGKTNTPELTLSYETRNRLFGQTNNPYDLSRSPGGSSGGAAAILAAGGSPLDVGSDTGGSIRYPCHCCGIAGIKPTSGRVPRTGHVIPFGGIWDFLTQLGPMARSVGDLQLVLPLLAGPDGRDPAVVPAPLGAPEEVDLRQLRVCYHTSNGLAPPSREVKEAVLDSARALEKEVLTVEEQQPPGIEETSEIISGLWSADGGHHVRRLLTQYQSLDAGEEEDRALSMSQFTDLLHRWDRFRTTLLKFLQDYDVLLSPVFPTAAPAQGDSLPVSTYSYTQTHNLTGWPAAVVPVASSSQGLPLGVQIAGHPWREHVVLAVAGFLESVRGGFRPPPL